MRKIAAPARLNQLAKETLKKPPSTPPLSRRWPSLHKSWMDLVPI